MFSNSSGEIRTMEHRVAHIVHTPTPTSGVTPVVLRDVRTTPSRAQTATGNVQAQTGDVQTPTADVQTPTGDVPTPTGDVRAEVAPAAGDSLSAEMGYGGLGYHPPKKSRSRSVAVGVGLLAVVALIAFFMSQRSSGTSTGVTAASDSTTVALGDTVPTQFAATPLGVPDSAGALAAAPVIDSQAIKDSIRKARREAALKKAAADSLKKASEPPPPAGVTEATTVKARVAAQAMLSNATALKAFNKGATHKGGVLGAQRRGDLQTQIDALAPFLAQKGLSYDQFKSIVKESGVTLFDEFGRMLPGALQRFASGG
jgi:hypothetical protein